MSALPWMADARAVASESRKMTLRGPSTRVNLQANAVEIAHFGCSVIPSPSRRVCREQCTWAHWSDFPSYRRNKRKDTQMRRIWFAIAIVAFAPLTACKTTPDGNTSALSTKQVASSGPDGSVHLIEANAKELVGVWKGRAVMDSGDSSRTALTIMSATGNFIHAYFEYRWQGNNYARHPDSGTIQGEIGSDGKLHFGSWDLALSKDGADYIFSTRQPFAQSTANLSWSRSGVQLTSASELPQQEANANPIEWPSFQAGLMPGESSSPVKAKLPLGTSISDPDPEVGDAQNAYLGVWSGWMCRDRVTDLKIAFKEIDSKGATITYASGNAKWKHYKERLKAKYRREAFIGTFRRGDTFTLQMRSDGNLNIRFEHYAGSEWCTGILSRTTLG